ncbi:MAG: hypothetical protein BGN88_12480 [Clostridiales bacterium 43-6]|nr:MAG: hypothetical protein BGN88_12480 [Clostridiales bacterium 43-6]
MNDFFNMLVFPLKILLEFFNDIFGSYAVSIIIFTILVNACLFPLNIKQQKSQSKQALLKPKLDALKEKFGSDKMKYNTEMQALYQREGVNMAGGCLPLLIRLPILMGVYQVVLGSSHNKTLNFDLFGIDLAQTPKFSTDIINAFHPIWLIPVFSFLTAMLSSVITMQATKKTNPQAGSSMGMMMLLMPVMSLWMAFQFPGALGYYWACSNIVLAGVQMVVNKFYSVDKITATDFLEKGLARRKQELTKLTKRF